MVITTKYMVIDSEVFSKDTKLPYRTLLGKMIAPNIFKPVNTSFGRCYDGNALEIHNVIVETITELENKME